jgi:hypothetical protein
MKGEGRVRAWAPVGGAARSTPVTCSAAVWLALLAALCLTLLPPPAQAQAPAAERRVALVVGNADYVRAPLVNPVNDAADLAAALRRLGFEVLERRNRGSEELKRDLIEFQDKLGPGAVGFVTDRRNGATDVRRIGASNRWVERASRGGYAGVDFEGFWAAGLSPAASCLGARYDCPSRTRQ